MLQTYLKTAFRNLVKNRKHSLLNILGLSVALGACIIVFLVVQYETSYDKHLKNYKNIYQVVTKDVDAEGEHYTSGVPFPSVKYLRQDFPQYIFAEMMQNSEIQVTIKTDTASATGKKFYEKTGMFYGEPELLQMFEVKFLAGNKDALKNVSSVALSRSTAEKYFGNWNDAIGKRINLNNSDHDLQVAAIFEDVPQNSDFPFKMVASYVEFIAHDSSNWPLNDWDLTRVITRCICCCPTNKIQLPLMISSISLKKNITPIISKVPGPIFCSH
jgi:hypothetical protein